MSTIECSVVVPVFNEEEAIPLFVAAVQPILEEHCPGGWEIWFVDDGSSDATWQVLRDLYETDPRIRALSFSRNFGKEAAVSAGLDFVRGRATIVMDVDLQDPPEVVPQMLERWRQGFDVVYGMRTSRRGESWLKRTTAFLFYRVLKDVADGVEIPADVGDFRLMSRRVVEAFRALPERQRYLKGMFAWVGYPSIGIPYERRVREVGHTKWNYWKLWNFALEGITSFSTIPLRMSLYLGFGIFVAAILFAIYMVITTLLYGNPVPGYPSLMVVLLTLGGIQLMVLGVLGEYVGRIYFESKRRPLYLCREILTPESEKS